MENKILVCWDVFKIGENCITSLVKNLKQENEAIDEIFYLYCESNYIHEETEWLDNNGKSTKLRIESLKAYFSGSSIKFTPFMISDRELPDGEKDNITRIQKVIEAYVFPKLTELNPKKLHISLASGTREMIFAWIYLYSSSKFTRSFGSNVMLWHYTDDKSKLLQLGLKNKYDKILKLNIPKDPSIDSIAQLAYENKTDFEALDLDLTGTVKMNCSVFAPMLILGERGIGKSTLLETTILPEMKRLHPDKIKTSTIQTIICGQLSSELADSELFGYKKGAFTGADKDKNGAIKAADGGILFLDEIQDLSKSIQRKLLRVLQTHKFSKIGSTEEESSNFLLVCASNKNLNEVKSNLDDDFFDRIATFVTELKPLREHSKETLEKLWKICWTNCLKKGYRLPQASDSFDFVAKVLIESQLYGNIRDVNQLIAYIARDVYQGEPNISENAKSERYEIAKNNWKTDYRKKYPQIINLEKTFIEEKGWSGMEKLFKKWLAEYATELYGSKESAAQALGTSERTIRNAI